MDRRVMVRARWVAAVVVLASTATSAQWVAVGRKVVGRISSVVQPKDSKNPGYAAATVVLDAEPAKVYAAAVSLLKKNTKISITKHDDAALTIAFAQGDWSCQMKITDFGDHLSQLLIVSGAGPGDAAGISAVLDAAKRVCDQLGVKYTVE